MKELEQRIARLEEIVVADSILFRRFQSLVTTTFRVLAAKSKDPADAVLIARLTAVVARWMTIISDQTQGIDSSRVAALWTLADDGVLEEFMESSLRAATKLGLDPNSHVAASAAAINDASAELASAMEKAQESPEWVTEILDKEK